MDKTELEALLGRPLDATDQPPGTYRWRRSRNTPLHAVRIIHDGEVWHCLVDGSPVLKSGKKDPTLIPFISAHAPFHPISEEEYLSIIIARMKAEPGTPLDSDEPVDLRRSKPL